MAFSYFGGMNPSLLLRLRHQPVALDTLLAGLTEAQVRSRPQPEKWSILENIAHLGRYHLVFLERMETILKENRPAFDRYVADTDPGFGEWRTKPTERLLAEYRETRAAVLDFLAGLTVDQLRKTGVHPVYGPMSVEGWAEFFLLHEAHHYFTILKLAGPLRA
ncbi:DinB family protein [Larkinella soli]|uniref:DinB family protein n=1 Tax=Larkinella soli TaxID=1770527 RepID=UPI000FFC2E8A|nr:DinB family protein [Larkinella soli]